MTHGGEEFVQGLRGGQPVLEGANGASRIILLEGTVPGLEVLGHWVLTQERLGVLRRPAPETWHAFDESSVILRIVEWRCEHLPAAHSADTLDLGVPMLLVLPEAAEIDLAHIPPRRNLDVLRQPYDPRELLWRVQRAVRSSGERNLGCAEPVARRVVCGPFVFDPTRLVVSVLGRSLPLRRAEREILVYLMQNAGRFVSTRELQERVLGTCGSGSAARNQVYEVRSKLRAHGLPDAIIHRSREGYRLSWSG